MPIFNFLFMINFGQFMRSLGHAYTGLKFVWRENNFRIQILVALVVIVLMYVYDLSRLERVALLLVIMSVLILEAMNTIFEHLADILKPRLHDYIKIIKDIMASVVLMAAVSAIIVGLIIFWPHVFGTK